MNFRTFSKTLSTKKTPTVRFKAVPLFNLVNTVFNANFHFDGHDAARSFFLDLQNEIKNMNFMPFKSERYDTAVVRIQEKIQSAVKGHS